MILYFADRGLNILGSASTGLQKGVCVSDDIKTDSVETGVSTFECDLLCDSDTLPKVAEWVEAGNFLLRSDSGDENVFFTIIETEEDSSNRIIHIYCEDAGIDLLNDVVGEYEAGKAYSAEFYVNRYLENTGFEIGINEAIGTKQLEWSADQTVTERLLEIADEFGCELSYSFEVRGMKVTKRLVNIWAKRGADNGEVLRFGRELSRIIVKKSVADLATGLYVTGATPSGSSKPINLSGQTYDDGDIYISGNYHLFSREALKKWSRVEWSSGTAGHIVKRWDYDTTNQNRLLSKAVSHLKKIVDTSTTYEVDINYLPPSIHVGDYVQIVDSFRQRAEKVRLLKLRKSVANKTWEAELK